MYLRAVGVPVQHMTLLNVLPFLEAISHLFKASVLTLISPFFHPPESDTLTPLLFRMEIQHFAKPGNARWKISAKSMP